MSEKFLYCNILRVISSQQFREVLTRGFGMRSAKDDSGGSNKRRSEVVTVRLDPRLKYLAEIAARKQRRTLSGYIEWAVEKSLAQVVLKENDGFGHTISVSDAQNINNLWDVDESERLIRLAFNFPELLTYEEQLIWRLIRDCGYLWRGHFSKADHGWEWNISESALIWDRLKEHWETFKSVAANELPREKLPRWEKVRWPVVDPKSIIDDDIPF
jgi:hypothetical protein